MDDKENSTAEGLSPTAPLTMPRDYRRTLAEPPPLATGLHTVKPGDIARPPNHTHAVCPRYSGLKSHRTPTPGLPPWLRALQSYVPTLRTLARVRTR